MSHCIVDSAFQEKTSGREQDIVKGDASRDQPSEAGLHAHKVSPVGGGMPATGALSGPPGARGVPELGAAAG